jgi:drug/metabolite transporter (DMT)-like permease
MTSSWMLVAGFLFAAMGLFVKMASDHFGAAEIAFYRSFITLVVAFAVIQWQGGTVKTAFFQGHAIRGIVGGISLIGFFYAIGQLSLATALTLNYTSPIFLAIATVVVLGERFSAWLVVAVLVGFGGVALLLQPTFQEGKDGPAMIGLFSGVLASWAYLAVRTLGRMGEPDWRVVFYFGLTASVLCGIWQFVTARFTPLTAETWWMLAAVGISGTAAQVAMTRAWRVGNTLVVGSLSYSTLVFAAVFAFAAWGETLGAMEWAGMGVIVASGVMAMRVEKKEQVEEAGFES